jgi:hypothetical protein
MGIYPAQGIILPAEVYYFKINSETELASGTLLKSIKEGLTS